MIFSDHLSRNVDTNADKPSELTCEGLDLKIHDVSLNASDEKCISLATETDKDAVMQALKHQIIKGWPSIRTGCPGNLQEFWNYHDELSVLDRLILKGSQIVIPESCRDEILAQLHEGHFGIDRTKLHASDSIYWPNINKDIECLVNNCDLCQEHSRRNCKDPLIPCDIPVKAWTTLQMDLFMLDGYSFLLVVDITSRFAVVRILNSETTKSVLNTLKCIYCNF